jgi:hypothetical protein
MIIPFAFAFSAIRGLSAWWSIIRFFIRDIFTMWWIKNKILNLKVARK